MMFGSRRCLQASSLVALLISLSVGIAANAAPVFNSDNGLPPATSSPDGQFIFVPLVTPRGESSSKPATSHIQSTVSSGSDTTDATSQHRPRVILALGGGGMRGAAHVGVLKALVKAGIPIDGIAGTSMGSIVGGMYSAGVPLPDLERHFTDGSMMKHFMTMPLVVRIILAPVLASPRLIGFHPYDGLYFGFVFHNYLDKCLPENKKTIESLNIPYSAVAINLCDGHVYAIRKGDLTSAMQASSAVPALRKPIEIKDKLFVDGGVLANVPVPQARQLGGDVVIAVQIDERFLKKEQKDFRAPGSVTKRMIGLQLAALDSFHEQEADIVIHPNVDGITLISTKKSDARRAILAGEQATNEAIPAIKKRLEEAKLAGMTQTQ